MDHKMICVNGTKKEPGAKGQSYNHQVKKRGNNVNLNANANKKIMPKTITEYIDLKMETSDEYLDASSENAITNDDVIEVDNYLNYTSRQTIQDSTNTFNYTQNKYRNIKGQTYACKSKTEIKQFMDTYELVFDKFSDILFDVVKSDYNANSQKSSKTTTLQPIGE